MSNGEYIINIGFYVGVKDGCANDFYNMIKHIYELIYRYVEYDNKVVSFYYDWFDSTNNGTKFNLIYEIVNIQTKIKYTLF